MYIVQHVLDADTYVLKTHTHKKKKHIQERDGMETWK